MVKNVVSCCLKRRAGRQKMGISWYLLLLDCPAKQTGLRLCVINGTFWCFSELHTIKKVFQVHEEQEASRLCQCSRMELCSRGSWNTFVAHVEKPGPNGDKGWAGSPGDAVAETERSKASEPRGRAGTGRLLPRRRPGRARAAAPQRGGTRSPSQQARRGLARGGIGGRHLGRVSRAPPSAKQAGGWAALGTRACGLCPESCQQHRADSAVQWMFGLERSEKSGIPVSATTFFPLETYGEVKIRPSR